MIMDQEPTQRFTSRSLFPILSAEKLLAGQEHSKLLSKLQAFIAISQAHYEVLYGQLIHNFAEFVQILPLGESGGIASVLNEGLEHAFVSVQMLADLGITKTDQLLTYAVFSAALMQDLGKVAVNRKIMISDRRGIFIQEWLPHGQPMSQSVGSHFKIRYTNDAPLRMSSRVTPIFARQLMPERSYSWIASNPRLLTMWLAALGDTTDDDSGTVGIHLGFALRKLKADRPFHLPEVPVKLFEGDGTHLGEAFWEWLQKGLVDGKIEIDKPGAVVESVAGGLLLHAALFRRFHEGFLKSGDWVVTKTEFNYLGLTELSGGDGVLRKYYGRSPFEQIGAAAILDKATKFSHTSSDRFSFLGKQVQSLASNHPTPEPGSDELIVKGAFLPDLSPPLHLEPKLITAEKYFESELALNLENRPPLFQPENPQ